MNKLIVIGMLGTNSVYLNVPREEAIRRYNRSELSEETDRLPEWAELTEIEFTDEFWAYDVSGPS